MKKLALIVTLILSTIATPASALPSNILVNASGDRAIFTTGIKNDRPMLITLQKAGWRKPRTSDSDSLWNGNLIVCAIDKNRSTYEVSCYTPHPGLMFSVENTTDRIPQVMRELTTLYLHAQTIIRATGIR